MRNERNRADQAEIQKSKTENLLKEKQIDIEELLKKLTKSQHDSRNWQEDLNAKITALESEISRLKSVESKNRELGEQNIELIARVDKLQDDLLRKEEGLGQKDRRIGELERENSFIVDSHKSTCRELHEKEVILQEFNLKLEELLKGINEKTLALRENEALMESLKGNFAQMELKMEQKTSLVEELKKIHLEEIKATLGKLNTAEVGLAQKQTQIDELVQKNTHLMQELANFRDKLSSMDQTNKTLDSKYRNVEEGYQKATEAKNDLEKERACLVKKLDESNLSLEVIKSSLKSRQASHEQTIEELSKVRNQLNKVLYENSAAASSQEEIEAMRLGFEKQIVRLRVELERGKEQFNREKKLLLLRIEELEEQQQTVKENQTPTNNKVPNQVNTTPTLNITTPPGQQSVVAQAKVKTPKQQFKYKSFLSPDTKKEEVEEKKPSKQTYSTKNTKEPVPECSQQ